MSRNEPDLSISYVSDLISIPTDELESRAITTGLAGHIYVSGVNQTTNESYIRRTTNFGASWSTEHSQPTSSSEHSLATSPDGLTLYFGFVNNLNELVISTSDETASTFIEVYNFGYLITDFKLSTTPEGSLWLTGREGGFGSDYILLQSTDGGQNWTERHRAPSRVHTLRFDGQYLYLISDNDLVISDDFGLSWSVAYDKGLHGNAFSYGLSNNNRLFVAVGDSVYLLSNDGSTWTQMFELDLNAYYFSIEGLLNCTQSDFDLCLLVRSSFSELGGSITS